MTVLRAEVAENLSWVWTFDQAEFKARCEWGLSGLKQLAPISDVVLIINVSSVSTALDIAAARGASVFPYPLSESAQAYAESLRATLASSDRGFGYSLSPASLRSLPPGSRLVLPSCNGAALAFSANHPLVLASCLRNASASGRLATRLGSTFAVIPAGEAWPDGELRPSLEDWVGAGAVIASLPGKPSPEANLAALSFEHLRANLSDSIRQASSGKELVSRGFSLDVQLAAELDVSRNVPKLKDRAFIGELVGEP